jgi:hypothetical protein
VPPTGSGSLFCRSDSKSSHRKDKFDGQKSRELQLLFGIRRLDSADNLCLCERRNFDIFSSGSPIRRRNRGSPSVSYVEP